MVRTLLSYLPGNNLDVPPRLAVSDPADRMDEELVTLGAVEPDETYDVRDIIEHVVDGGEFFEMSPWWAENLVTGFARLGGQGCRRGRQPAIEAGRAARPRRRGEGRALRALL